MDIQKICGHCMRESNTQGGSICPFCGKDKARLPEVQHQLAPFTILQGKYLVGTVLGEGGFGITYIGLDMNLEFRVAIKEFYPNGFVTREAAKTSSLTIYTGSNEEVIKKWKNNFLGEARSLAKCANLPGVVGVKDYFEENNTVYIVQEFLEGQTLKDYVKAQGGKVGVDFILNKMKPIMQALIEVHKQGIIHRDISPDNIMLLQNGSMKVLDFGAARSYTDELEKSKSVMLKPGYAPEEQYRTKGNQGPWTDVYALTATIYRCITGTTPIESMERLRADSMRWPSDMGIPIAPWQQDVIKKGMAVFADQRYQSMQQLYDAFYNPGPSAVQNTIPLPNTVYQQNTVPVQNTVFQPNTVPIQNTMYQQSGIPVQNNPQIMLQQMQTNNSGKNPTKLILIIGISIVGVLLFLILALELSNLFNDNSSSTASGPGITSLPGSTGPENPPDPAGPEVEPPVTVEKDDYYYKLLEEANNYRDQGNYNMDNNQYYDASVKYNDAIKKYLDCYNYIQDDEIIPIVIEVFEQYENATIQSCDLIKYSFATEDGFNELTGRYDSLLQLGEELKGKNIDVDTQEARNKKQDLYSDFRTNFINEFNSKVVSSNWRREEAYYLMEQAYRIGLFDLNNLDDPLTLRYNYAKAYMVGYHDYVEKGKPRSAYSTLYDTFRETDCNLLLLSYMAETDSNMYFYYQTIINMIRDYQGLTIGRDVKIEDLYYFNDFGQYSIDGFNGVAPEYREVIRGYVRDVMNIY